ncbi:MAG TPA: O-antigen ligase family protein [Chloroflexota bacterium]|nr:O-antigen ligase family protein [Chloroflexota bacterium]
MTGPLALGAAGLVLTFTAPQHRIDLLAFGVLAVLASVLWRPMLGPLLIGAAVPFYFFGRPLAGPLAVSPPGLVLLLAWPAALIRCRRQLRLPLTPYDAPLALLLVASLLALLVSEYPLLSARELRALILEPVLFFWLLVALRDAPRLALYGFLASATFVALVAIGQVVTGLGGTEAEGVRRAQAWYPSPNHLALMLGRAWPFLLALALGSRRRAALLPATAMALAILLTYSSGGWLGAAVGGTLAIAALGHKRVAVILGTSAAVAVVVIMGLAVAGANGLALGNLLPERINPLRQAGGIRVDLWLSSLAMLKDHPLLGIGLDNFTYLYQQVYIREGGVPEPNLSHPHNWLLHWWLELGVLGLVAFVWLVVRFSRLAFSSEQRGWLVAGAVGAMADTLVHGLIDQSYFLVDLAFVFWLTLSLLV